METPAHRPGATLDRSGDIPMPRMIVPKDAFKRMLRKRRMCGGDRYDEVWNGVYVMAPDADILHQTLAGRLAIALWIAFGEDDRLVVLQGVNITDLEDDWTKNYRVPDVAFFLPGNPAKARGSHYFGGPDFAVDIITPTDPSPKKLAFYPLVAFPTPPLTH